MMPTKALLAAGCLAIIVMGARWRTRAAFAPRATRKMALRPLATALASMVSSINISTR